MTKNTVVAEVTFNESLTIIYSKTNTTENHTMFQEMRQPKNI